MSRREAGEAEFGGVAGGGAGAGAGGGGAARPGPAYMAGVRERLRMLGDDAQG